MTKLPKTNYVQLNLDHFKSGKAAYQAYRYLSLGIELEILPKIEFQLNEKSLIIGWYGPSSKVNKEISAVTKLPTGYVRMSLEFKSTKDASRAGRFLMHGFELLILPGFETHLNEKALIIGWFGDSSEIKFK